jgi:NifU-like protein involved in Fe-S cluster formation
MSYDEAVIEHFARPRNVGRFAPAADVIEATAGDAAQGVMFRLSAQIDHERLKAVRFEVYGCPHCIAAGSWLSERLTGQDLSYLEHWAWAEAAEALQFPPEKRGRLLILEDATRALAHAWHERS